MGLIFYFWDFDLFRIWAGTHLMRCRDPMEYSIARGCVSVGTGRTWYGSMRFESSPPKGGGPNDAACWAVPNPPT